MTSTTHPDVVPASSIAFFCRHPLERRSPDPDWADEARAAREAGFEVELVDHDRLVAGEDPRVDRRTGRTPAVYRGWMLRAEAYARLDERLGERGVDLVHDGTAYRTAHHLPEWYRYLRGRTPRSVWLPWDGALDPDGVRHALADLGSGAAVVKDYVKSAKHAWREATFLPDAGDLDAVLRVVRRFLEIQGEDLAGGLVFREWLALESGPGGRALEHRLIVLDGRLLAIGPHPDLAEAGEPPGAEPFLELARRVPGRFFAVDVARTTSGEAVVIEMGDGQVSTLPTGVDLDRFYGDLRRSL